jgi:hypothetical protein
MQNDMAGGASESPFLVDDFPIFGEFPPFLDIQDLFVAESKNDVFG